MYRNIYFDNYNSKVHIWETVGGKRFKEVVPIECEYFVEDKSGKSELEDIFGVKVVPQISKNKKVVQGLRDAGVYTCESDIPEDVKYLQKKYGQIKDLKPNMKEFEICYLDIECAVEGEFPKPEEAKYPINLITIHLSNCNETHTWGTTEYTGKEKLNYHYCATEKILLDSFISTFRKKKVDVFSGWYVNGFDIPYMVNRMEKLGVEKTFSPINKISQSKDKKRFSFPGISILDYIEVYQKFTREKRERYKLDYICNLELNEGKHELSAPMHEIYKTDWNAFVEYNVQDTILVKKLEDKLKYIELTLTLGYESLVPFERVDSSIATLTGYVLKTLHLEGRVMPDRDLKPQEPYPGAYCFAEPGLYEKCISFDIESLYPTIIRQFNISPETLVTDEQRKIDLEKRGMLIKTPIDGVFYDKSKKGIVPIVIEQIFADRKRFQALKKNAIAMGDTANIDLYDRMQYIRKILINSLYGVLGNRFFNLYNLTNAKTITLSGQNIIKFLSSTIDNNLVNYYYMKNKNEKKIPKVKLIKLIDTDSSYFSLKELYEAHNPENKSFMIWTQELENTGLFETFFSRSMIQYSKQYNVDNLILFKRESIINKMMVLAKKKYVSEILDNEGVIYENPKLKFTGIEVVRTDTPQFCRDKIDKTIKQLLDSLDKDNLIEYMKKINSAFKKANVDEIAIPKGVSSYTKYANEGSYYVKHGVEYPKGCPIHVRASINYNYLNSKYDLRLEPITNGTKMRFVHTTFKNELRQDVIGFVGDYPEKFKSLFTVDYDRQWKRSFQSILQRFFDVLNWGEINFNSIKMNKFIKF